MSGKRVQQPPKHRHVSPNGSPVHPVMRMPGRRMEWHDENGNVWSRADVRLEVIR